MAQWLRRRKAHGKVETKSKRNVGVKVMGIQSTVVITREEAEQMYVEKRLEEHRSDMEMLASRLSPGTIEDYIEEHFYNYFIGNEDRNVQDD
jgi:hypothetical protein